MGYQPFVKNAHRYDPYKNYKFRVSWPNDEGKFGPVLGVSKVSALKRSTEVVTHRAGDYDSWERKTPGRHSFEAITMERGVTHSTQFEAWANKVCDAHGGDPQMSLHDFKRDLKLEVMNEKGHTVLAYMLVDCWVSEYTAVPDLDAGANAIAIESLKVELDHWYRIDSVKEPDESGAVPEDSWPVPGPSA
jgi:phage tail-like protein